MPPASDKSRNRLRIIGGDWRSRVVVFADIPDVRPTPDRVRETLFNWLQPVIAGRGTASIFSPGAVCSVLKRYRAARNPCGARTRS